MNCNICGHWFKRGTTTLPNWCDECLENVTVTVVEPSIESQIERYEECIEMASQDIADKYGEIARNKDNIKFWEEEIRRLRSEISTLEGIRQR